MTDEQISAFVADFAQVLRDEAEELDRTKAVLVELTEARAASLKSMRDSLPIGPDRFVAGLILDTADERRRTVVQRMNARCRIVEVPGDYGDDDDAPERVPFDPAP